MGMNLQLPKSLTAIAQIKETRISIDQDQVLYLEKQKISFENLASAIKEKLIKSKDLPVIISADQKTPYGMVIQLLDSLRRVGCTNIIFEASKLANYDSK